MEEWRNKVALSRAYYCGRESTELTQRKPAPPTFLFPKLAHGFCLPFFYQTTLQELQEANWTHICGLLPYGNTVSVHWCGIQEAENVSTGEDSTPKPLAVLPRSKGNLFFKVPWRYPGCEGHQGRPSALQLVEYSSWCSSLWFFDFCPPVGCCLRH